MEKSNPEQALANINILKKTAVTVILTIDDAGDNLVNELEYTAKSIHQAFGLDESVMSEYHQAINDAKSTVSIVSGPVRFQEAENTRDMIYELCDGLDDPKEIMRHVRTSSKLLNAWLPSIFTVENIITAQEKLNNKKQTEETDTKS